MTRSEILALLAAVEDRPGDSAPRLVLADAVEEAGGEYGGLLRTCRPERKHHAGAKQVFWLCERGKPDERFFTYENELPAEVFFALRGKPQFQAGWCVAVYLSDRRAYLDLARAVVRLAGRDAAGPGGREGSDASV